VSAYLIFDVEIRDMTRYQDFLKLAKPAVGAACAWPLAQPVSG
jgi:uncharacterized protein (DUF1330 family)